MDREKLAVRLKQPGHDRSFTTSETSFAKIVKFYFGSHFDVVEKPDDLRKIFSELEAGNVQVQRTATNLKRRPMGLIPELKVESPRTKRKLFFEVKKQGKGGNAEERAMKHHTKQFYATMHQKYQFPYHPFITIFCEELASNERYTRKFPFFLEEKQYFLWQDYRDVKGLVAFLTDRFAEWLEDDDSWSES